ncbi:MAG: hypothetical protein IT340_08795 [Chloroflexi bacterium]|nr:hypothetical protein [Chloroflexota bacterium]
MKRFVVIVALALLGIVVPWQLGYDPAMLAASSDVIVGWTVVRPSPVITGKPATFESRIQARVPLVATIDAVMRDSKGTVVWQQRWTNQTFKAWQSRAYTGAWSVPAGQATGPYVLTVTAAGARSQTTAAVAATAASSATKNLAFQVVKPTPTPAASAPSPTPAGDRAGATSTTVPPTATAKAPTSTAVPPTKTAVPPTATAAVPTATTVPPTQTAVPPTNTPKPPTATTVPPTQTAVPPTNTPKPPTNTPVPPTNTPVPPTATAVPPTNTPKPPTATPVPPVAGVGLDVEEANFLRLLNDYRRGRGLGTVAVEPHLQAAASWMAADSADRGVLSHRDSLGRDPGRRMVDHGYSPYAWMCEVALGGSETGQSALTVWQLSPPHNGCLIDAKYVSVGIGRAWGPIDGWRWTVNFGSL